MGGYVAQGGVLVRVGAYNQCGGLGKGGAYSHSVGGYSLWGLVRVGAYLGCEWGRAEEVCRFTVIISPLRVPCALAATPILSSQNVLGTIPCH